jgi:NAD(P) transhydrogenase subunit alpha
MDISPLTNLTIIFALSCVIGYFVVWGVTPALHTPLMAVTNAISGIVLVAAMVVAGPAMVEASGAAWLAKGLGFAAVTLCAINIFGGFAITRRMLNMFKRKEGK